MTNSYYLEVLKKKKAETTVIDKSILKIIINMEGIIS